MNTMNYENNSLHTDDPCNTYIDTGLHTSYPGCAHELIATFALQPPPKAPNFLYSCPNPGAMSLFLRAERLRGIRAMVHEEHFQAAVQQCKEIRLKKLRLERLRILRLEN